MMPIVALNLAAAGLFSGGLKEFQPGQPVKSAEVNDNFRYVDSLIQRKASQGGMDALSNLVNFKADQVGVDKALAAKADTATVGDLARRQKSDAESLGNALKSTLTDASLAGIRDSLKGKQNSLGFTPLNAEGGAVKGDLSVGKALACAKLRSPVANIDTLLVPGARLQSYPDGSGGALYADNSGVPGMDNYALAWTRTGQETYMRGGSKYLGVSAKLSYPVFSDGSAIQAVLHTGMLDTNRLVKTDAVVFKGNESNDITTRINPNGRLKNLGNNYNALRLAIDFGWYGTHWQIGNVRGSSTNSEGFGISQGDSALRFLVREGGATVYGNLSVTGTISSAAAIAASQAQVGDLRVSGTLVTAPGEKPADYVFEPDYPLAPLSEVEAYTKAHKHLPEVPSAAAMETQGVDLARMNMVLLKKVEELTLHAIAQEKRLQRQERLIEKLLEAERP